MSKPSVSKLYCMYVHHKFFPSLHVETLGEVLMHAICPTCIKAEHLRTVPTKYKGFCARLGPRGQSRYLKGLLESTKKNWGSHAFFRDN